MAAGVYAIINIETNKVYIGSTVDFKGRWVYHKSRLRHDKHDNSYLQHSWNKYGEDAFEFGVLEYLDNLDNLHLAEQLWMDKYREEGIGLYNLGLVADRPTLGYKHTEEHNCKISIAHKGKRHSKESIQRMSDAAKGRKLPPRTEEHRSKLSEAAKKQWIRHKALGLKGRLC